MFWAEIISFVIFDDTDDTRKIIKHTYQFIKDELGVK